MPFIDYTLVAEFDVDAGATLVHVAPDAGTRHADVQVALSRAAERMLPEGSHAAATAFTVFPFGNDGMMCLSVARTRLVIGSRRGAEMRSLACVSKVGWLDLLRPLVMAALDAYFEAPVKDTVLELHAALNAGVALPPLPSRVERALLRGALPWQQRSAATVLPPGQDAVAAVSAGGRPGDAAVRTFDEVVVSLRPVDGWRALVRIPRWIEVRQRNRFIYVI